MSHIYEIDAQVRNEMGKGASRRLRHADKIPAVVYGAGEAAQSLLLSHNEINKHLKHEGFYSHILSLNVAGKKQDVVLKAVQRHPYKARVMHMDFMRVKADQPIRLHVPLHFTGEADAPGVKDGGTVSHVMTNVEVECLPRDLPEFITVDVSGLALDEALHLSQLALPKGVSLPELHLGPEHDRSVVSIHVIRESEDDLVADAAEAALKAAEHEAFLQEHPEAAAEAPAAESDEAEKDAE